MKTWHLLLCVYVFVMFLGNPAMANVIYFNDFENTSDMLTEWSNKGSTPSGDLTRITPGTAQHPSDRFIGQFTGSASTNLVLDNIPSGAKQIRVSFDLYVIRTWDGHDQMGPDVWKLRVTSGPELLCTTFNNFWSPLNRQDYPGTYPGSNYAPRTGCAESDTLGFRVIDYDNRIMDSVYHFYGEKSFIFDWSADSLTLVFSGHNLQSSLLNGNVYDESWGLDNVMVEIVTEPPEPPWSFVQISDTHIGWPKASGKLKDAVNAINQMSQKPDFILVTGDIADSAWFKLKYIPIIFKRGTYKRYLEIMDHLDNNIDHYEVPGNHDRYVYVYDWISYWDEVCLRWDILVSWDSPIEFYSLDLSQYNACLGDFSDYNFEPEGKGIIFVGMDSGRDVDCPIDFRGTGLTGPQMEKLQDMDPSKPKVVFMHHPAVNNPQDEKVISCNRDNFIKFCQNSANNVKLVLCGHTHKNIVFDRNLTEVTDLSEITYQSYPLFIQTPAMGPTWFDTFNPGYYRIINVSSQINPEPPSVVKIPSLAKITTSLYSHANVHVYDSSRRHVGINISGEVERGIPQSFYLSGYSIYVGDKNITVFPEEITIYAPLDDYFYEVIGSEEGTYRLDITYVRGGEEIVFKATDIPTSPGERHVYRLDWQTLSAGQEGVTLDIDADGDGIFERTVIADEDLTAEEFALQTETVVDFKPETVNLASRGKFVTVYIELPEGFDVSQINVSSLLLNETVSALSKPIEIGDYDSDGITDLMVKFERQQVADTLEPGEQLVTIFGRLLDGTPFSGMDIIRVLSSKGAESAEQESDSAMTEELVTETKEKPQTIDDDTFGAGDYIVVSEEPEQEVTEQDEETEIADNDSVDMEADDAVNTEEAAVSKLTEAVEIINELGPDSFNNEESFITLTNHMNDVLSILDEGLYTEALTILENDILEITNGCAEAGQPDENDWIMDCEVQGLVYPLILEAIELLKCL